MMKMLLSIALVSCVLFDFTAGHGYMRIPAARNCMWRYGFQNPTNYNDNELFCGGAFEMAKLGKKCGVCGDQINKKQEHADGGKYSNGIIARTYKQGQVIDVEVLLTTSHWGYFEFRIGDFTNKMAKGDGVGKLQGHLMQLYEGGTRYKVKANRVRSLNKIRLRLPPTLRCKRCVIQWWYKAGNNWGCDSEGCGMGHGTQEHFVNCADVAIN